MVNEEFFKQAVMIATAFIQNGDVRCGGKTGEGHTAMLMTGDLITSAYRTIEQAHQYLLADSREKEMKE